MDAYYKELDDLIASGEATETIIILDENDNARPYDREYRTFVPQNLREGSVRGLDLTFTLNDTASRCYYGMLAYTYSEAKSRKPMEGYKWEEWDARHCVTFMGGYRIGKDWEIGWKWRFNTGFPYTPLTKIIRVVDDRNQDGRYEPEDGETFTYQRDDPESAERAARYPDYHRLDLRIQYQHDRKKFQILYYLDIINVYGRENVKWFRLQCRLYPAQG